MVPNISDEIVEKQKTLQAGTCLGFGMAFKIPLICKLEMPNPAPWSGNCDVVTVWNGNGGVQANVRSVEAEVPSIPSIPSIPSVPRVPSFSSVSSESSLSIPMINNKPLDSGSNDTVNFSTDSNTSFVSVSDANRPKAMPDATMENTSNSSGFPDLDNLDLNDHTLEDDDIDTPARGVISGVSTFDNMANTFEPTSTVSNVPDLGIPGLNITQSDNSNQSNFISFGNNISDNSQSANPIDIVTPNGTPLISLTPEDK